MFVCKTKRLPVGRERASAKRLFLRQLRLECVLQRISFTSPDKICFPTWHMENCSLSPIKRLRSFGLSRSTWAVKAAEPLSVRGISGHIASALWLEESNNILPFLFLLSPEEDAAGKTSD